MANQTLILNVSDEMKLDDDRQNLCEERSAEELCSSSLDTTEEFADIITKNLNTDFTAMRMIGYLYRYDKPSLEDVADEMLAILEDRNRIMEKKELERVNAAWNEFLNTGFEEKPS